MASVFISDRLRFKSYSITRTSLLAIGYHGLGPKQGALDLLKNILEMTKSTHADESTLARCFFENSPRTILTIVAVEHLRNLYNERAPCSGD